MALNTKEAKKFLEAVQKYASNFSKNAVARQLNVPIQTFNSRLLEALTILEETPPAFFKGRARKTHEENIDTVRHSGQGGTAKRIIIPQRIFNHLGWEVDDKIKFRTHGKRKLIIEKLD